MYVFTVSQCAKLSSIIVWLNEVYPLLDSSGRACKCSIPEILTCLKLFFLNLDFTIQVSQIQNTLLTLYLSFLKIVLLLSFFVFCCWEFWCQSGFFKWICLLARRSIWYLKIYCYLRFSVDCSGPTFPCIWQALSICKCRSFIFQTVFLDYISDISSVSLCCFNFSETLIIDSLSLLCLSSRSITFSFNNFTFHFLLLLSWLLYFHFLIPLLYFQLNLYFLSTFHFIKYLFWRWFCFSSNSFLSLININFHLLESSVHLNSEFLIWGSFLCLLA